MPKWLDADHAGDESALMELNTPAVEGELFQRESADHAGEGTPVVVKAETETLGTKDLLDDGSERKQQLSEGGKECENVESVSEKKTTGAAKKCCVCETTENVKRCSKCKSTYYCSTECQKSHLEYHSDYCSMIVELKKVELDKLYGDYTVRQKTEDVKTRKKLIKLVGEKPLLKCLLGGKNVTGLWDSGSQVCIVGRRWVKRNFPNVKLHPVSDFYNKELQLLAANKTKVGYDGVIVLSFSLDENDEGFEVPILVSEQEMSDVIFGSNVIKELILNGSDQQSSRRWRRFLKKRRKIQIS